MDQQAESGSQQTRLSGFFRNVHAKFSRLSPKVDDVVVTSHVVGKKPQLVIGTASHRVSPPELVQSNGMPLSGTKRKSTTHVEDVMNNMRMNDVSTPSYNDISKSQPAMNKDIGRVQAKVMERTEVREQDSDGTAMNELISNAREKSKTAVNLAEVLLSQNCLQSAPTMLQGIPPCQWEETRVDTEVGKLNKEFRVDCLDSEICTSSGNFQRKDELLGGNWSLPVDRKGDAFSCKLEEALAKPFDEVESKELWKMATRRKPVLKLRQTRGRTMQVNTKDEGMSYFDHNRDFAERYEEASHPLEKLALLRCFFFWIQFGMQHSCMEGAYKPWAPATKKSTEEDDCDFTDGLDCEVIAVVLPLDERKDVNSVMKSVEPTTLDLSDDDEDDCVEVSVTLPVKSVPPPNGNNFQKAAACNYCSKGFGMEIERQRALYKSCGHIETCVKCVDKLWMEGKQSCQECGEIQSVRPRSIMDFADDSD